MQRNHDWYNKNEARSWPLDDSATLVDDLGRFLPSDILADLHLWFPDYVGPRAFVSAVTVSPTLVTLVILGSAAGSPAIATVSLIQPVVPYRQYALEPKLGGAGGWVVFGSRVDDVTAAESYRFSNPEQGLLLARTAQQYKQFPVTGVAKVNTATKLTGIVNLRGGHDIETLKAKRTIDGKERDVAVIRLRDKTTGTTERNVSEIYAGPCGARPESVNCGDPQPIEFINEVAPDCCGRIYIELRGCAELFDIANMNGVILDCPFDLKDACSSDSHLPDDRGRLPNEYDDLCETSGSSATVTIAATDSASESFMEIVSLMEPDVVATAEGLPFAETFANGSAPAFTVESGGFQFQTRSIISGTGYGGSIFFMSFINGDKCYLRFGEEHGLLLGDRFVSIHVMDDKQILIEHKVMDVENDVALFSEVKKITDYTTPPTYGAWIKLTGFDTGPDGGGFGISDRVYPFQDNSWYETDDTNLLSIGDKLVVLGNSDGRYNQSQKVVAVSGPDFVTDLPPGEVASRSAWMVAMPRGGGEINVIRNGGRGELRIDCREKHGLRANDCVVLCPRTQREYLQLHEVTRILSPTEFVVESNYQTDDSGLWYLVRAYRREETIYESDPYARSISLWTEGAPQQPNWTCLQKQISVTMRLRPMGAVYRLNGGIIFNYQPEDKSFVLLELDNDAGKLFRLWQVKNNRWTVWQQRYITDLDVTMPYRLSLDVLPYSNKASDALIVARLDGFEQESQYQLEPIRIPQFVPSTGLIGLHTNRACVQFSNFSVQHLD